MVYLIKSARLAGLLSVLLIFAVYPLKSEASQISLDWTGHVTHITSFRDGAVPTGISIGSSVRGDLTFDSGLYSSSREIMGDPYGNRYRYTEGLQRTIDIETWKWSFKGADVSLLETHSLFDVQS